jgi:hypothetical protein
MNIKDNLYIGTEEAISCDIPKIKMYIFKSIVSITEPIIIGSISARNDFKIVVLNTKNINIGVEIKLIIILYGEGIKIVVRTPNKDKRTIYVIFCFFVDSIFNNAVNNNIVTVISMKLQGISSTFINSSFVVVSADQTALSALAIFENLH